MHNLVKFYPIVLKIMIGNEIAAGGMTDGHNGGQSKFSIAPLFQSRVMIILQNYFLYSISSFLSGQRLPFSVTNSNFQKLVEIV